MTDETILLYGATWCPDCKRSKAFLTAQRIPFTFIDLEKQPEAAETVRAMNDGKQIIPTIVFPDGSYLVEPSDEELAEKVGLGRAARGESYDLVIVGGGPTGLTTGIYAARENLHTLIVDRSALGGQAGVTERLDNYPGFPEGIGGADLADRFAQQAQRYGVEALTAVSVTSLAPLGGGVTRVTTSTGQDLTARAVLIATGSTYRRTGADGEDDLIGAGIHFCATCDGPFYKGAAELVVLGGGNSGFEEGLFLTQFADHVTIVERSATPRASRLLQDKVAAHPKMSVLTETSLVGFNADDSGRLASLTLASNGHESVHAAVGAFVFIGLDPNTAWLDGLVELDAAGFIVTDRMMVTSVPGIFAAGDVRGGSTKQLASAVGEGAAVALQIRAHLDAQESSA